MNKPKKTPTQIAEDHWFWLETLLHKVYVDAFVHGHKHGKDTTSQAITNLTEMKVVKRD